MVDVTEQLRDRWQSSVRCLVDEICSSISTITVIDSECQQALDTQSQIWLEKVAKLHAEPHRAYHNFNHVQEVIASLEFLIHGVDSTIGVSTKIIEAILMQAAFFHDVVYNPRSSTNEKDSADTFIQFVSELRNTISSSEQQRGNNTSGVDNNDEFMHEHIRQCEIVAQIEECIIATATHISSAETAHKNQNSTLATFLDADMSILGKNAGIYDKYAVCIRKEYEFVERKMYCDKRADILESFLPLVQNEVDTNQIVTAAATPAKKHSFIYATEKARKQWEEQARKNLKNEIGLLRSGAIPCELV